MRENRTHGSEGGDGVSRSPTPYQVRFFEFKFETRLDSGFRRNDRNKSRLPVDNSKSLGLEPRVVQLEEQAGNKC